TSSRMLDMGVFSLATCKRRTARDSSARNLCASLAVEVSSDSLPIATDSVQIIHEIREKLSRRSQIIFLKYEFTIPCIASCAPATLLVSKPIRVNNRAPPAEVSSVHVVIHSWIVVNLNVNSMPPYVVIVTE